MGAQGEAAAPMNKQICYNCGSHTHALRTCKAPRHPDGKLPFASCFICKGTGHISKDCKENPNGLYPKGGGCLICTSKFHFAKDCPDKKTQLASPTEASDDDDQDVYGASGTTLSRGAKLEGKASKRKLPQTNLGGDDDDFDFDVSLPTEKGHRPEEEAEDETYSQPRSAHKKKAKKH